MKYTISKIILPVRPQIDTCIAIFLLTKYGSDFFIINQDFTIKMNAIEVNQDIEKEAWANGTLFLDIVGSSFDHHGQSEKTTSSQVVANYLGVQNEPEIKKLLDIAYRDDVYGKGTLSDDQLDRAFGLAGLLAALNKSFSDNPTYTVHTLLPLLWAHHNEEHKRTKLLPIELEDLKKNNKIETFNVKQRKKNLKVIIVQTSSPSMAGFLRSRLGGGFDVVVQIRDTGHVNILTRQTKRIDLRSLVYVLRKKELEKNNITFSMSEKDLAQYGKIDILPYWFYDTATNTMQNGGIDPKDLQPCTLDQSELRIVLEIGLSETSWSPVYKSNPVTPPKKAPTKTEDLSLSLADLIREARK